MTNSFEQLYLEERKKARIFITVSAILAALLLGLAVYAYHLNIQPQPSSPAAAVGGANMHGGPVMMGSGGGTGEKVLHPGDSVFDYLNADGSVNTNAVTARLNSLQGPPQMMQRMLETRRQQIDEAYQRGEVTSEQADALKEAWGIQ